MQKTLLAWTSALGRPCRAISFCLHLGPDLLDLVRLAERRLRFHFRLGSIREELGEKSLLDTDLDCCLSLGLSLLNVGRELSSGLNLGVRLGVPPAQELLRADLLRPLLREVVVRADGLLLGLLLGFARFDRPNTFQTFCALRPCIRLDDARTLTCRDVLILRGRLTGLLRNRDIRLLIPCFSLLS